jgi:hypothetical protein
VLTRTVHTSGTAVAVEQYTWWTDHDARARTVLPGKPATVTPPSYGPHYVYAYSVDKAGNRSDIAAYLYYAGRYSERDAPGDLNGDDLPDIWSVDSNGTLLTYAGQGNGQFEYTANGSDHFFDGARVDSDGDWGHDGYNDLVSLEYDEIELKKRLWAYPNNGGGVIGLDRTELTVSCPAPNEELGCFGEDGWTGDDHWHNAEQIVAPGDMNGDGHPDLLAKQGKQLWAYYGNRNTLMLDSGRLPVLVGNTDWDQFTVVAPGDINGDKIPDLWLRHNTTGDIYRAYGQKGPDGHLDPTTWGTANRTKIGTALLKAADYPTVGSVGDITGDGLADLWARKKDNTVRGWPGKTPDSTGAAFGTSFQIDGSYTSVLTDFDGDGSEDIAISDPAATVGGHANAGLVRIVYGGGKGVVEINQDLDWVAGGAEEGDAFGDAIDTVDYNEDGYTDLVVGSPKEDVGTAADAGFVDVLYGAAGGLGTGTVKSTHLEQGTGAASILASSPEAGDRMGDAVAAGTTAAGEPYLVIGVPGESLGTAAKAGSAFYLRGKTNIAIHQDKTDVPGGVQADDGFGAAVAADANHIAIGAPNESISDAAAGNLVVFSHTLHADGHPQPLFGLDQDLATVSGGAEAGDEFGYALTLTEYRPAGTATAKESVLAIGSPGETMTVGTADVQDAGRVVVGRVTAAGAWDESRQLWQGTNDDEVSGTAEAGDRMGEALTAINTNPRAESSPATMRLAVGTPGEALGTTENAGAVHTFSLVAAAGANDRWLEAGDGDGIPGTPGANQYLGRSIHYTTTHLYVGMPYGPGLGALYALPMSNTVIGGTVAPVTTYKPGAGGLPSVGKRFGAQAR